ncbi:LANO_0C02542g1_1 [Lachancea nothofagi CBS 11611]|uniref:LANO_0C02542g1_1 n=1 Tax=Lachancea nothofagi CBS 11611 TaxID=1266666 RepID=A0A1G4J4X5_9SACH|nr:LANO_0C02542g1_1 [Lachancea nothofagi CBS 11611]
MSDNKMAEKDGRSKKEATSSDSGATDPNGVQNGEDLYPLALLMDELKHDDIGNRVEAMKKLDTIAIALGPQRARDELVPFLTEVAQDDEDEVFAVLAEQLGKFVPFIGGSKFATLLLPALEILASTEETLVRDKAVESLNNVAQELSEDQLFHDFIPLIEHLATADWFSSKVSSCGLFRSVLARVKDDKFRKELLALYLQLVQDETPMVRRAAGKNLPVLIDLLTQNPDLSTSDDWDYISNMFQKIIGDTQDSVKFLAVDVLVSILKFFNKKNDTTHAKDLLRSAIQLITDEAWRVRYMAAERFEDLASQFKSNPQYIDELSGPFLALCEDNESDVRKGVAKQLPGFSKLLGDPQVVLKKVLPAVQNLSMDESELVRASLASEITNLAPLIPKQDAIDSLIPILLNMLKDEYPDVRLNIIAKLKVVNEVVGIDLLSESLLPAITELAKDVNWRVRMAIIDYIPLLAEQLGVEFFDQQLGDLCLSWLWDTVYSIRSAAVVNLKNLTKIFGSDWSSEKIISRLLKSDSQLLENFVYRITLLSALTELVPVVSAEVTTQKILPFINHLADDAVPNIRFNVAQSYVVVLESLRADKDKYKELINRSILSSLEKLREDSDIDVRYFANRSLERCQALLA